LNQQPAPLWSDSDLEKRWGKKPGFASDLRARGQGPHFLRLSARTVRYRPEDVLAYEQQQRFGSIAESMTSEYLAPPQAAESPDTYDYSPAWPARPEPGYRRGPYKKKSSDPAPVLPTNR
jgi:hypothetical protein